MSKSHDIVLGVKLVSPIDMSLLVRSEERRFLSRQQVGYTYTLRGVPGRYITFGVFTLLNVKTAVLCAELESRAGRFDGTIRDHITIRYRPANQCDYPEGMLTISPTETDVRVAMWDSSHGIVWSNTYHRLRSTLAGYDLPSIVFWHWARYYRFIDRSDAEQVATLFEIDPNIPTMTLSEANRLASRMLYQCARDLGWRKLTIREQRHYNVSGQWHRVNDLDVLHLGQCGLGDATIDASQGKPVDLQREVVE